MLHFFNPFTLPSFHFNQLHPLQFISIQCNHYPFISIQSITRLSPKHSIFTIFLPIHHHTNCQPFHPIRYQIFLPIISFNPSLLCHHYHSHLPTNMISMSTNPFQPTPNQYVSLSTIFHLFLHQTITFIPTISNQ